MDRRILQERMRVISKCERDGWLVADSGYAETTSRHMISGRIPNESKRRQIVEKLLDRTLANYLDETPAPEEM